MDTIDSITIIAAAWGLLVLRLTLALILWPHGAQKVLGWFGGAGWDGTYRAFTGKMGIPPFLAKVAMLTEFFAPICLVLGIFTRLAALSVIIMVIQVAGSGGVYPIDVLPGIFQTLYKFMPFHYGMDMLRETIAGRYENVYWKNLAVMAAMCVLFAVLGMVLYYPARPLNRLIARSKEKSGIM